MPVRGRLTVLGWAGVAGVVLQGCRVPENAEGMTPSRVVGVETTAKG